jgi:aspartate ammonia-lyase
MEADAEQARVWLDRSTAVATALSPYLGYGPTAEIAKAAVASGRPIRDLVLERGLIPSADLDRILSARAMTEPGIPGERSRARGKTHGPGERHPARRGNARRKSR